MAAIKQLCNARLDHHTQEQGRAPESCSFMLNSMEQPPLSLRDCGLAGLAPPGSHSDTWQEQKCSAKKARMRQCHSYMQGGQVG